MRRGSVVLSALALVGPTLVGSPAFAPEVSATIVVDPEGSTPSGTHEVTNTAESFLAAIDYRLVPPNGDCSAAPRADFFDLAELNGSAASADDLMADVTCTPDGFFQMVTDPFTLGAGTTRTDQLELVHPDTPWTPGCWVLAAIVFPSTAGGDPMGPEVSDEADVYAVPDSMDPSECPPGGPGGGGGGGGGAGAGSADSPATVDPNGRTDGTDFDDFFQLLPPDGAELFVDLRCGGGNDRVEIQIEDLQLSGQIQIDVGAGTDTIVLPPQMIFFEGELLIQGSGELIVEMPDPFWPDRSLIQIGSDGLEPLDVLVQRPPLFDLPPPGQPPVEIQIVDLSLQGVEPIDVIVDGSGRNEWAVEITIDEPDAQMPIRLEIIDTTIPVLDLALGLANDQLLLDNVLLPLPLDPLGSPEPPWVIGMGGGADTVGLELVTQSVLLEGSKGQRRLAHAGGGTPQIEVDGGPGNDVIVGSPGPDRLLGGDGDDVLDGGPGADVLTGGAGADVCIGRGGIDQLSDCLSDPRLTTISPRARAEQAIILSASDNIGAAIAWSQDGIVDGEGPVVLLGRDDLFADSLASGFAQGALDAPLLLTQTASLDARVLTELRRLGTTTVHILGGPAAISEAVHDALVDEGFTVTRVFGDNRVQTAIAVATAFGNPTESDVVLARSTAGEGDPTRAFIDALAAGSGAAARGWPLLLTETSALNADVRDYLLDAGVSTVWIAGGVSAVSTAVEQELQALGITVNRRAGQNRYETAARLQLLTSLDGAPDHVVVVGNGPDAWAQGLPAARTGAPLALASGANLSAPSAGQVAGMRDTGARVVCAPGLVSSACAQANALSSSPHHTSPDALIGAGAGVDGREVFVAVMAQPNQPWICANWLGVAGPGVGTDLRIVQGTEVLAIPWAFNTGGFNTSCLLTTNAVSNTLVAGTVAHRARIVQGGASVFDQPLRSASARARAVVTGGVVDVVRTAADELCVLTLVSGVTGDAVNLAVGNQTGRFGVTGARGVTCSARSASQLDPLFAATGTVELTSGASVARSGTAHRFVP